MRYLSFFIFSFLLYSCDQKENTTIENSKDSVNTVVPPVAVNSDLITDSSFGQITRSTTYADLQKIFGSNLTDTMDYGAEGLDSFIVTKAYINTPKEIVIGWKKNKLHKEISEVYCAMENSPYHTEDGLKVGSTLGDLLKVNGKKINFSGTGWDYGGFISSFNGGKFEKSNIYFNLDARENAENVMGDQDLNTDMQKVKPNLQKLYIIRILVILNDQRQ